MPLAADNLFADVYTEVGHSFVEWDVLRKTSGAAWAGAQADSVANAGAPLVGLCVEDVGADTFSVLELRGVRVKLPSGNGLVGTFGDPIYLDPAAAKGMTLTKPTSDATEVYLYLGRWIDANTILWDPDRLVYLPSEAPDD